MTIQEESPPRAEVPPRARRRSRRLIVTGALVVVLSVGGGLASVVLSDNGGDHKAQAAAAGTSTTTVVRQKLVAQTQVSGTLGYSGGYTVVDRAPGTYTWLPSAGQIIKQGHMLYALDGKPVVLLRGGKVPAYRNLAKGTKGPDVRQLNAALVELGYATTDEVDPTSDSFDAATADAVKALQKDLGASQTGRLPLGQVVFQPAASLRITKIDATYGAVAQPGMTVLEAGSTTRTVSIALDVGMRSQVKTGDGVTVTLPDGRTVPGTISWLGAVATKGTTGGATLPASVRLADSSVAGGLDQAPVQITVVTSSVPDALAVPVTALLALANGNYALEAVRPDGSRRFVPVSTGLFDDSAGLVQVTGPEVVEGLRVVVPAT